MKKIVSVIIIIIGLLSIVLLVSSADRIREELSAREPKKIAVVVLNGTSVDGLASRIAEFLRENGCDVLQVSNAESPHRETIILDRADNNLSNARRIHHLLGVGEMAYEPDPTHIVEATVVIGDDYNLKK